MNKQEVEREDSQVICQRHVRMTLKVIEVFLEVNITLLCLSPFGHSVKSARLTKPCVYVCVCNQRTG
jgi:hypothetical protein